MTELSMVIDIKRETDLAWAAGIIDGEGCIGMYWARYKYKDGSIRHEYPQWKLSINQATNNDNIPEIIIRLKQIFKFGTINKIIKPNKWKIQYRYQVCNKEDIEIILKQIWPYLGEVKRQQAKDAGLKING